jgi:hypothetical protein
MQTVLQNLETLIGREMLEARSEWRLVDILTVTTLSPHMLETVKTAITKHGWSKENVIAKLIATVSAPRYLEGRNRRMTARWIEALKA